MDSGDERRTDVANEALEMQPSAGGTARRIFERLPAHIEVHVNSSSDHNFYTGFTQNISEGGLFIATSNISPLGTQLEFTFTLHPDPESITVRGVVRWIRESHDFTEMPPGMGVMFHDVNPIAKARMDDFIRRRRESIFYDDEEL